MSRQDAVTAWARQPQARIALVAMAIAVLIGARGAGLEMPVGTVLQGVLYGGLNGVLAIGLVITFRISRSINFAYGAMGGLGAGVGVSLFLSRGMPWAVAVLVAVLVGAVVGGLVGTLVERRFGRAPRLVVTVATIGLAQLLGGLTLLIPRWLDAPALIPSVRNGLDDWHLVLRPVVFNGNDLVIAIVVPVVVVSLTLFLLRTDAGIAIRGIADNPERARLAGVPVGRLMLAIWVLSGAVAALATMLAAPSQGVPLSAAAGPALLLPPLAAAVVARMESLPIAFCAALALGIAEQVVRLNSGKQSIQTVVFCVVIFAALLLQRASLNRFDSSESAWGVGRPSRHSSAFERSRTARSLRYATLVIVGVIALTLPHWVEVGRLHTLTVGLILSVVAVSLVVLSGWTGVVSLGQIAIVGIGAVTSGYLMIHLNLDLFLCIAAAAVAGAIAAVVLGLPALRVRGSYLAVITLAFAVVAEDYIFNPSNFPGLMPENIVPPLLWSRFPTQEPADLYYLCLAILVLIVLAATGMRASQWGRRLYAVRDNARAAAAASVSPVRTRIIAFAVSGAIAGLAGPLILLANNGAGYKAFPAADSIAVLAMVVIGGATSIGGSVCGVALVTVIGIAFPQTQLILTGVGVLVVLALFPEGLAGLGGRLRDLVLARLAARRGITLSVWADETDRSGVAASAPGQAEQTVRASLATTTGTREGDDTVPMLRCRGVNASYGQLQVLFGVDLDVDEGEIVALLGTNGAGKSSLLRAVTGFLPCSSGTVTFDGVDRTGHRTEKIVAGGLTMMPGGRGIFPSLTVEENLRIAAWSLRHDPERARAARAEVGELFEVLDRYRDLLAGNLSGGEQQMLSLAFALIVRPKLLCIDELSLGLAPTVVSVLVDAVRELNRRGTTVVIVEQSVTVALMLAERAVFMDKGEVRFSGATADLLERPDLLRAIFIGGQQAGGNQPEAAAGRVVSSSAVPALECLGLTKRFAGVVAVDDLTLRVAPGEVMGLIGHNGAGKTTFFDVVGGFVTPSQGQIRINGLDVTQFPAHERAHAGLGRSFQDATLYPTLTVRETVAVALDRHYRPVGAVPAALRMPADTDLEVEIRARVAEVLALVGLEGYADSTIGTLSTGTRRIVELACVLAQRPSVLLLDEPSGGVAQAETESLGPLLRSVAQSTGCAMIVIEHDMGLITGLCERLVALEYGAIIADGPAQEVLAHPRVIASYLGSDDLPAYRSGPNPGSREVDPLPVT